MSPRLGDTVVLCHGMPGKHVELSRFMVANEEGLCHHNMHGLILPEGQELAFYIEGGQFYIVARKRLREIWEPKDDNIP